MVTEFNFKVFLCLVVRRPVQITTYTWLHLLCALHHLPDPHLLTLLNEACCTLGISVAPGTRNSKLANSCHLDIAVISICVGL